MSHETALDLLAVELCEGVAYAAAYFLCSFVRRELLDIVGVAVLDFDQSLFEASLTHRDPDGDADEIRVFEFRSRPNLAVIQQYFHSVTLKRVVNVLAGLPDFVVLDIQTTNQHMKRRDGHRPDDPGVVVM